MKHQDDLKKEILLLSDKIEKCQCPETKTLLLKRARVLLASASQSKIIEAKARIDRLNSSIPKVYKENPHALTMIEERQPGHEKFLPFVADLSKGKRIRNQIITIASQFDIDLTVKTTEVNRRQSRRTSKDKRLVSKSAEKYCTERFKRLAAINATIDDKDVSIETRRAFVKGKSQIIKRETEFNGTRRNDKQTNNRLSWNPDGTKLAGAKGAK